MKTKIPFPIQGPFLFHITSGKIISAEIEGENWFSFQINGKKAKFKENEIKNNPKYSDLELFFNDLELYSFLEKNRILENYNLAEEWESELYETKNLWLFDKSHVLTEDQINKLREVYDQLERVDGLVDWKARSLDENGDLVLGLKDETESSFLEALKRFDEVIEQNIAIAVMPSSKENQWGGIGKVAKVLSQRKDRIDCSELFYRFEKIEKQRLILLARNRVPETHWNSIRLNKKYLFPKKKYYILDDVTTTGVSLKSVKTMLKLAGIDEVRVMAFGNTLKF